MNSSTCRPNLLDRCLRMVRVATLGYVFYLAIPILSIHFCGVYAFTFHHSATISPSLSSSSKSFSKRDTHPRRNIFQCHAHSSSDKTVIKICQNKHCKKNFPCKYDGGLAQVIQDILPPSSASSHLVSMETTGCFSHCQSGPNVEVNGRVFNKVDGVEMAAAILDVGGNIDAPEMGVLMAAVEGMAEANSFGISEGSYEKKLQTLSTAIGTLVSKGLDLGMDLSRTNVMAHALLLRADVRLEQVHRIKLMNKNTASKDEDFTQMIDLALDDAMRAVSINNMEGRAWRIVADCKELQGDILGAMEAVAKWGKANPSFVVKAKKEMSRLASVDGADSSRP